MSSLPRLTRLLGVDTEATLPFRGQTVASTHYHRVWRAVDRCARHWPWGDTCLRRALVLARLLRRLEPTLRVGVKRDEGGHVVAHAWVEVGGISLDPESAGYAPLGLP